MTKTDKRLEEEEYVESSGRKGKVPCAGDLVMALPTTPGVFSDNSSSPCCLLDVHLGLCGECVLGLLWRVCTEDSLFLALFVMKTFLRELSADEMNRKCSG